MKLTKKKEYFRSFTSIGFTWPRGMINKRTTGTGEIKKATDIEQNPNSLLEELAHSLLVVGVDACQDLLGIDTGSGNQLFRGGSDTSGGLSLQSRRVEGLHNEPEHTVNLADNGGVLSVNRVRNNLLRKL